MAYHICGKVPLTGEIRVQGSKNGALPLLAAALLVEGRTTLIGCPDIADVSAMLSLLACVGCQITREKERIIVDACQVEPVSCPEALTSCMRSSIMLLGPMLGRCKRAVSGRPGGCVIGARPIDLHLSALAQMGVCFEGQEELIAVADDLHGATIHFPFPSVGATENVIMAAVLAKGTTCLYGAAKEPEIVQLCLFLVKAGASITGIGTDRLVIRGVERLYETEFQVPGDRIVAGTYLLGAVATRGKIALTHIGKQDMGNVLFTLQKMGAVVTAEEDVICVDASKAGCSIPYIRTEVFPGFPTDLQSMLAVCLSVARGNSILEETIFEDRFKIVEPLWRMGARIRIDGRRMQIIGTDTLCGREVAATDLRGGAALVLAGLVAKGETIVEGDRFICRGYEAIERDLGHLGAMIDKA